jgi:AmmeMemoRadiSam system protein B
VAVIVPHAGLMYSGPVAAHAYRQLQGRSIETVVLIGPSHFTDFEGVALYPRGGFDSPLGVAEIDADIGAGLLAVSSIIRPDTAPHVREHSLEMQLPFLRRVAPAARIVPLLMGRQTAGTAARLADALTAVLQGRSVVLVASSDLSHYEDAETAHRLDGVVIEQVRRFDPDGLQAALEVNPRHACGGGPMVAVLRTARRLGAENAEILDYGDSGDVSGDKSYVVGYLAAAMGTA